MSGPVADELPAIMVFEMELLPGQHGAYSPPPVPLPVTKFPEMVQLDIVPSTFRRTAPPLPYALLPVNVQFTKLQVARAATAPPEPAKMLLGAELPEKALPVIVSAATE